jgi:hypothetical protein
MRNLIITILILVAAAFILGQIPGDGVKALFVAIVAGFAGLMLGARYGGKDYVKLMDARAERMATPVDSIGEATL